MEFLNEVPQDILDKYTSIYRTLFQASAQLETSTVVLNNLYGKNNASDLANEYVAEQLDFINGRIDQINKERTRAIHTAKRNPTDQAAIDFLNEYKRSVDDDINLMAELANKDVNKLSGGQKQRVAIARAIVNDPDVILADEPTGALDSATGAQIMELFKKLNKEGKTVIIVTHDREIAAQCGRVIEIGDGKICCDNGTRNLMCGECPD